MRVLITGADGFIGKHLCRRLSDDGLVVRAAVRARNMSSLAAAEVVETGDLRSFQGWPALLQQIDAVVHLVARTHVTSDFGQAAINAYRAVNVDVTRRLLDAAFDGGVRRFLFLSSIKAVGEHSERALGEEDPCQPLDSYGITKLEAEQLITDVCHGTSCQPTILRPPLVYGRGVRGNFLRLMKLVQRGIPLPAVNNRRSLIHVQNLVDAVAHCLRADASRGQVFHLADPEPISTTELVRSMALGLRRPTRLVPLPRTLVHRCGHLLGKSEETRRFTDSLTISLAKISACLGWYPRISTPGGVTATCAEFSRKPWVPTPQLRHGPRRRVWRAEPVASH